ncbi:hypothetical protein BC939DRAFT_462539 [Gamsiella multidivaricata]|uniref:uncharacterized protein n=1 Tax=Gamsiella multidivaricata TaxID=101098 RepID=UPI00221FDF76|nr:uncharacterized protein BC939DRAFT_462539 [Gamsiella multidivaricata]KAI7818576.1 hypothetical protein BC939DRAFT_462539 [Gamsiella multidivaricata]
MLLKKFTLLAAFVVTVCSGAVLPNVTALEKRPDDVSVQAVDFSICGAAIGKAAVELLKFSWNTGQAHLKGNAEACINMLRGSSQCSSVKKRSGKASAGDDVVSRCFCAYSVGTAINVENFLGEGSQATQAMLNTITGGYFTGANNLEFDCGDKRMFTSIVVSCASDSVQDRVDQCKGGTYSPNSQLVEKARTTVHLTKPDTPAPCEIRPPYCNRTPSNNNTIAN